MARAKRTERADARRRYRAATAGAPPRSTPSTRPRPGSRGPARLARSTPSRPAPGAPTPARPGFLGALRAAAGPVDIRGDLRALPSIVLRSQGSAGSPARSSRTTAAMMIPSLAARTSSSCWPAT